jgi:hypothetical protein
VGFLSFIASVVVLAALIYYAQQQWGQARSIDRQVQAFRKQITDELDVWRRQL